MGWKECPPSVYVVRWGPIWKVGFSAGQRWRKFELRGAELLHLFAFDSQTEAFHVEEQLHRHFRRTAHPAFDNWSEAVPFLGPRGGGWSECFCLCPEHPQCIAPSIPDAMHVRTD